MAKKVKWQGKISIEKVSVLREEIVVLLKEDSSLTIDISAVESIDTAGVQLLVALVREFKGKEGTLAFEGAVPKDMSRKLVMGGFTDQMIADSALLINVLKEKV